LKQTTVDVFIYSVVTQKELRSYC